jgi:hypothetical protein
MDMDLEGSRDLCKVQGGFHGQFWEILSLAGDNARSAGLKKFTQSCSGDPPEMLTEELIDSDRKVWDTMKRSVKITCAAFACAALLPRVILRSRARNGTFSVMPKLAI